MGAEEDLGETVLFLTLSSGCLLTIILLMRALDPLLYEKETLQYFQTLKASQACGSGEARWAAGRQLTGLPCRPHPRQAVDPMRAAYLDDLRSKFLLENSVLKMEYAEVRVLHLGHKVWAAVCAFPGPSLLPHDLAGFCVHSVGLSGGALASPCPWLWPQSQVAFVDFLPNQDCIHLPSSQVLFLALLSVTCPIILVTHSQIFESPGLLVPSPLLGQSHLRSSLTARPHPPPSC